MSGVAQSGRVRYEPTSRKVGLLPTRCQWGVGQKADLPQICLLLAIVCWKFSARFVCECGAPFPRRRRAARSRRPGYPSPLIDAPPGQVLPFMADSRPGSLLPSVEAAVLEVSPGCRGCVTKPCRGLNSPPKGLQVLT